MTVYLLHFDRPLSRGINGKGKALEARHYIGFTTGLADRILCHFEGKGARILQVCRQRGISFELARTWEGELATRRFERHLKNYKCARRLCPVCSGNQALERMKLEELP